MALKSNKVKGQGPDQWTPAVVTRRLMVTIERITTDVFQSPLFTFDFLLVVLKFLEVMEDSDQHLY